MRRGSFWREAVGLLVLAGVAATVSNLVAGPERKLRWIGNYSTPSEGASAAAGKPARPTAAAAPAAAVTPSAGGSGSSFPPHPDKAWLEISGDDVVSLHDRGGVLFLDARRSSVYRDGHIPGSRSVSVWEADVDDKVKALFAEGRDQSAPIVIYCSGGDCEDSHMLAQKLYFVGFDNVLVYKDGFPDWQKRGLQVSKGDTP
ncbi:MAG TPA: rhodanese-like domain-containing protein [Thermoanaerobaculia bacterium]|nr:rhodanese-like domain-containing protein [Thermoanaerobaculia bacterium]